jgi:hypothetical protein
LYGKQNEIFQQTINSIIFSRTPYSVKIFSDQKTLSTYAEPNGELIESLHDYLVASEKDMCECDETFENEQ